MPDVTKELLYRTALELKAQFDLLRAIFDQVDAELKALDTHLMATHCDLRNIHAILLRQDGTLARIERRLGIAETPT